MRGTVGLQEIYSRYHEQVQFLSIYIREAHPVDGWWFGKGLPGFLMFKVLRLRAASDVYDPQTMQDRRRIAKDCKDALQYGIRTYVDEMDDAVNKAYAAWPTRLYLVGLDGRVAYAGGLGPFGFKPGQFEAALREYLAMNVSQDPRDQV